jgi:hypothetical protein
VQESTEGSLCLRAALRKADAQAVLGSTLIRKNTGITRRATRTRDDHRSNRQSCSGRHAAIAQVGPRSARDICSGPNVPSRRDIPRRRAL